MRRSARAVGCACTHVPLKIIALDKTRLNAKGYHPAQLVEPEKCVGCASCATMCPDTAITVER